MTIGRVDGSVSQKRFRRRRFLQSIGVASIGAVAGCANEEDDSEPATSDDEEGSVEGDVEETDDIGGDGDPERAEINGVPVQHKEYDLVELPFEEWPQYGEDRILPPYCEYPNAAAVDEEIPDLQMNTVTLYDVEDDEGHHPLRTARTMMRLVHCYRESDDDRYLEKADSISEALVDVAIERGEAIYFPYGYDWGARDGIRPMDAPWYGGMAQGAALTAYAHLYEATGDEHYREFADRVFASFTNVQQIADDVWTTIISQPTEMPDDGNGDEPAYFWIEEYPTEPPNHVLNGFGVGLFGLYDYWLHVGGQGSQLLLEAALTTVEDHLDDYRVPEEVSRYDLAGGIRGNVHYHSTHINQLEMIANLSNGEAFAEAAETFKEDHPYKEYRPERRDWA